MDGLNFSSIQMVGPDFLERGVIEKENNLLAFFMASFYAPGKRKITRGLQ